MARLVHREWHGDEILRKQRRATGRGIVGIAEAVSAETKRVTHVGESGNLRRSVHAAPVGYDGSNDENLVADTDLATVITGQATTTPFGPAVEVGSWMPYACAEWVGRSHPGVTQGLEQVRGARADRIMQAAFRAEGLR